MAAQPASSLFLAVVFLVVGLLIGIVLTYLITRRSTSDVALQSRLEALNARERQYKEVVGLWRERDSGRLGIWSAGKPVASAQTLAEGERKQLEETGREFMTWLGIGSRELPGSLAASEPAHVPIVAPGAATPGQVTPVPAIAGVTVPLVEEPKKDKPLSIVEQINSILQDMMTGTPLEQRGIRLVEGPNKGVVVWIGLEHYEGVELVTDPQVKDLLRAAAAEWERRADRLRH